MDGSSKPVWKGSNYRAGGIGIYSPQETQSGRISISEPLPPDLRQTNNVAELWGRGTRSKNGTRGKRAILSDSDYVISGAHGQVHS